VDAPVLTAGLEVEPQQRKQLHREAPLKVRIEGPSGEGVRPIDRAVEGIDQRKQGATEAVQHGLQPGHGHLRLVVVEQRVVPFAVVADGVGLGPSEIQQPLQRRGDPLEAPLGPSRPPGVEPFD
jgi:hypothetical protein